MNNIVPDSVNDRINVLFKQINNANNTIIKFNKNFVDSSDNSLIIKSNTFIVDTDNSGILLGDKTNPDSMILYGTGAPDTITITNVPDGSLYLTKDNLGTGYIKQNNIWKEILTEFADITLNNLNISGDALVGNNMNVGQDINVNGTMIVSGDVIINGDLDISGDVVINNISGNNISGSSLTTNNITCSGTIVSTGNITSLGEITGNSLNINSKFNIDSSGNLETSGNIYALGNITGNIVFDDTLTVTALNVNSKAYIDSSGNIDTSGNINVSGNINLSGVINCDNDIITLGTLKSNTLNVNDKLVINNSGNLNTSGTIIANNSITTYSSISGNSLNINNKLNITNAGTLNSSGSINLSGNVNVGGSISIGGSIVVDSLQLTNDNLVIDSSGDITTVGNISATGNINNSGNIITSGSITSNSLNINSKTNISSTGNIDTSGYINAIGNISGSSINNLYLTPNSTGFSISGGTTSKTLTINNTLAFSGTDNTTITFPSTSQTLMGLNDSQNLTNKTIKLTGGTTTQAPLQFTAGTNLTNASGGAIEYDGNNYYATSIDCNSSAIRKILPNMNYYRITIDRDPIVTSTSNTYDVFPSGTFTMDANTYYIIEWNLNWVINVIMGAIRYDIVTSIAPQYIIVGGLNIVSPVNGVSMVFGTSQTTSLSAMQTTNSPGSYFHTLRAYIFSGLSSTIKLRLNTPSANITLKQGSTIFISKMPNANFGSFNA